MAAYMLIRLLWNAETCLARILWALGQSTLASHVLTRLRLVHTLSHTAVMHA